MTRPGPVAGSGSSTTPTVSPPSSRKCTAGGVELSDAGGLVATGRKQAFCLLDFLAWAWPGDMSEFDCTNQGISRGWADIYQSDLPCQWIDVTDVPPGDYTLRIEINQPREDSALPLLLESDYANTAEVAVTLP